MIDFGIKIELLLFLNLFFPYRLLMASADHYRCCLHWNWITGWTPFIFICNPYLGVFPDLSMLKWAHGSCLAWYLEVCLNMLVCEHDQWLYTQGISNLFNFVQRSQPSCLLVKSLCPYAWLHESILFSPQNFSHDPRQITSSSRFSFFFNYYLQKFALKAIGYFQKCNVNGNDCILNCKAIFLNYGVCNLC